MAWTVSEQASVVHKPGDHRRDASSSSDGASHEAADRLDRVDLIHRLFVAVPHDAGEAQRHPTGVTRRTLNAVEGDLDDLLGTHFDHIAVGRTVSQLEKAL